MMPLLVGQVTQMITDLCNDDTLTFTARSEQIKDALSSCTETQILEHVDDAGVIPECFDHDSTEEKLFAKYCDYLLAACWSALGMKAHAILERTDAADVVALVG